MAATYDAAIRYDQPGVTYDGITVGRARSTPTVTPQTASTPTAD